MLKRFTIISLILLLLCENVCADSSVFRIEFSVHQDSFPTSVSFHTIVSDSGIQVLSDLFPSFYYSVPSEDNLMHLPGKDGFSVFPSFGGTDLADLVTEWIYGMEHHELQGIYAGDAFDEAYSVLDGFCDGNSFILSLESFLNEFFSSAVSGVFNAAGIDLSLLSVHYRVFIPDSFLSLTGSINETVLFSLSADFSDKARPVIIWGYPEKGQNYYWQLLPEYVSSEECRLTAALYADTSRNGFRTASMTDPVLKENWILHCLNDCREMTFRGTIYPANEKSTVSVTGNSYPFSGDFITAELKFEKNPDTKYTLTVQEEQNLYDLSALQKVSSADHSDSAPMLGFSAEISRNILPLYTALLHSLPDEYSQIILNIN